MTSPRRKEPATFTTSVPQGKSLPHRVALQVPTRYRAPLPRAPPAQTRRNFDMGGPESRPGPAAPARRDRPASPRRGGRTHGPEERPGARRHVVATLPERLERGPGPLAAPLRAGPRVDREGEQRLGRDEPHL